MPLAECERIVMTVMVSIIAANIYLGLARPSGKCLTEVILFNPHLTNFIIIMLCRTWCAYLHVTDEETEVRRQGNVCGKAREGTWLFFISEPIHLTILCALEITAYAFNGQTHLAKLFCVAARCPVLY